MQVLEELGIRGAHIEKVADQREIDRYLTREPPGLVVNGKVVWTDGKELPTKAEIASWLCAEMEPAN
jgi:hypothetical protein